MTATLEELSAAVVSLQAELGIIRAKEDLRDWSVT